jgi:hypothetical protein
VFRRIGNAQMLKRGRQRRQQPDVLARRLLNTARNGQHACVGQCRQALRQPLDRDQVILGQPVHSATAAESFQRNEPNQVVALLVVRGEKAARLPRRELQAWVVEKLRRVRPQELYDSGIWLHGVDAVGRSPPRQPDVRAAGLADQQHARVSADTAVP